jgi:nucleotide-binding universal stress UspA family protein
VTAIQHILFPFDFSAQGAEVVPFVEAMGRTWRAKVTIFSVVPPTWDVPPAGMRRIIADTSIEAKRALQRHLDESLTANFAGVTTERVADAGDPALRITAFSDTHGVGLIMMPTHGLGPFRTLLMGSVASKVLHDAACPVWTAVHAETQSSPVLPRKVLCAIDETPKASALLGWVAGFCQELGASLSLIHVVEPITDWPSLTSERARQDHVREAALDRVRALQATAGVEAPLVAAVGEVVETVTEQARRDGAELLVIGRGSVAEPFGRLRTHAFGIIQRSLCPVLSV